MAGRVPTAYERLGVVPEASAAEITSAYRRLLRRHHPDSRDGSQVLDHDDHGAGENAAEVLAAIIDAYAVLRDPASRAEYDRSQQPKRPMITHRAPAARQDFLLRVGPVHWQQGPR
jgi:curved DNA-binding protein CbpA